MLNFLFCLFIYLFLKKYFWYSLMKGLLGTNFDQFKYSLMKGLLGEEFFLEGLNSVLWEMKKFKSRSRKIYPH